MPGGDFDEEDVDPPGGAIEQPWLASADVDGDGKPELLLPQKNFVRAVVLEKEQQARQAPPTRPDWVFRVKDQINGAAAIRASSARRRCPTARTPMPSIFLLDAEHKVLTLCERDTAGVWQVVRNVDLPVSDFNGLQSVALGGTDAQQHRVSRPERRGLACRWRARSGT